MARRVLLDPGPIGEITHPKAEKRNQIRAWAASLLEGGVSVTLPEIVDYEHRRKLLHLNAPGQLRRLDEFKEAFGYEPLTTRVMTRAAELWAEARRRGVPTAPEAGLDVDVISAAQALVLRDDGDDVTVATTNPGHLSLFVDARLWQDIQP